MRLHIDNNIRDAINVSRMNGIKILFVAGNNLSWQSFVNFLCYRWFFLFSLFHVPRLFWWEICFGEELRIIEGRLVWWGALWYYQKQGLITKDNFDRHAKGLFINEVQFLGREVSLTLFDTFIQRKKFEWKFCDRKREGGSENLVFCVTSFMNGP